MEDTIQFIANCDDWKVIKKLKVTKEVPPLDIIDFLASVSIGFENTFEKLLKKTISLDKIDSYIKELVPKKTKKEEDLAKILKGVNSPNLSKLIKVESEKMEDNKSKDKIKIYLKVYATKKALAEAGLFVDFSKLPISANKGKK
jgi:hypothetical protein